MASVYLAVWLIFVFALAGALTVRSGDTDTRINDSQLINSVNTVQVFQLGLLSVIPYWAELCLETGFLNVRPPGSAVVLLEGATGRCQSSEEHGRACAGLGGHPQPDGVGLSPLLHLPPADVRLLLHADRVLRRRQVHRHGPRLCAHAHAVRQHLFQLWALPHLLWLPARHARGDARLCGRARLLPLHVGHVARQHLAHVRAPLVQPAHLPAGRRLGGLQGVAQLDARLAGPAHRRKLVRCCIQHTPARALAGHAATTRARRRSLAPAE